MMGNVGRKVLRWVPVLLWMAAIFYLSAQPDLPHHPEDTVDLLIKKVGHMAEYGILAALVWWAWPRGSEGHRPLVVAQVLVFSGLYAITDEVHQIFVPGRNGQLLDVGFDVLGAAVAMLLVTGVVGRREAEPTR